MRALTIRNLQKIYKNGVAAVRGVDLEVEEGDFFALLGPNGAGKSSIIGIISSLVNKTSGSVQVFNHDLDLDKVAAKTCMGLVPQELNFNQFDNVLNIVVNQAGFYGIPRKLALQRSEKYLSQLGLWSKRNEPAKELSGGMKRRLMIARALVHEPRMLVLDEPTAGVDIELRRTTWDFLEELNRQGTTIILTTHYLEEAETLCRGIAIIDKGVILERTDVKNLLTQLPFETVRLDLQAPITTENLPTIAGMKFTLVDQVTLEVMFPKSHTLNTLFIELSNRNIHVTSMRNKTNRLEELFLSRIAQHKIKGGA
jgi:ABC-2 type transport system ATP-binding protein